MPSHFFVWFLFILLQSFGFTLGFGTALVPDMVQPHLHEYPRVHQCEPPRHRLVSNQCLCVAPIRQTPAMSVLYVELFGLAIWALTTLLVSS